jgi:hypothetical protein
MTRDSRYTPARTFGNILVSLLAQLILLCSLIATGKAQQKQGENETGKADWSVIAGETFTKSKYTTSGQ